MTQWKQMSRSKAFLSLVCLLAVPLGGFAGAEESFEVYTEHPRLMLRPARLRLLQRERQRQSPRWTQLERFMAGKARMPEPGFAHALYYRITGDRSAAREATQWALGPGADLRQLALVFDWCQDVLTPEESKALGIKLQRGIEVTEKDQSVAATRSRLLAAIALAGHLPQVSARQIRLIIGQWWRGSLAPALKCGQNVVSREDIYPLFEFLHAVRDNLEIDLRESAPGFFKTLPAYQLLSYYPAAYPAPENEYRIPAMRKPGEPDVNIAALSRAAELGMVAYDTNAPESQALQGWLMHDRYMLRSPFGTPYEFLWANPYQPGLSYFHVPLVFHDDVFGRLYARSSWEDDAVWSGYSDGELQVFRDGRPGVVRPDASNEPLVLAHSVVVPGGIRQKFQLPAGEAEEVFVVGLRPSTAYLLEIDDEEMAELRTDRGGILAFTVPPGSARGIRFKPAAR